MMFPSPSLTDEELAARTNEMRLLLQTETMTVDDALAIALRLAAGFALDLCDDRKHPAMSILRAEVLTISDKVLGNQIRIRRRLSS
jgi:hypothetical protein